MAGNLAERRLSANYAVGISLGLLARLETVQARMMVQEAVLLQAGIMVQAVPLQAWMRMMVQAVTL